MIKEIAKAISLQTDDRQRAKAAIEAIALYYENALDAVGYGNISATEEDCSFARKVSSEMRRVLTNAS